MNIQLNIINPVVTKNWNEMIETHSNSTIFHTSYWAQVLMETYHYLPLYLSIIEKNEIVMLFALMEINSPLTGKRGVSLPFTDFCEPLIKNKSDSKEIFEQLKLSGKQRSWKFLELRDNSLFNGENVMLQSFYTHSICFHHNSEDIFSLIRSSTKRNIKKAEKSGVQIQIFNSTEGMDEFYRLNCQTRKRHGLPPQPFKFFKNIYQSIIANNLGFIVLARYKNKYIAGAIFFHFGKNALYKYGASDSQFQSLRANNLIMWTMIKHYADSGYKNFSFGRTDLHHSGLRQFKNGWNTQESILNYYRFDLISDKFIHKNNSHDSKSTQILQKLPIPILKLMGNVLYKHMG